MSSSTRAGSPSPTNLQSKVLMHLPRVYPMLLRSFSFTFSRCTGSMLSRTTTSFFAICIFALVQNQCLCCKIPPVVPDHPAMMHALKTTPSWERERRLQSCAAGSSWITTINNHVVTFRSDMGPIWHKRQLLKIEVATLDDPLMNQSHVWTPSLRVQLPATNEFFRFTISYMESPHQMGTHYEWGADAVHKGASLNANDDGGINLNVWILMMDGVSLPNYLRSMPQTRRLLHKYDTLEMTGHAVSGMNTAQNVWPLITGFRADKGRFRCARKDSNCTKKSYVDHFPTVWSAYKQKYLTVWGDDWPEFDPFTEYHNGFENPPTHHFMKPLWDDVNKKFTYWQQCASGQMKVLLFFQYGASLLRINPAGRKFVFFDMISQTHHNPEFLNALDRPLKHFLREHLLPTMNNTILWLMADHGPKQGLVRQKAGFSAVLEFSNPLLSVTLPSWFASSYPQLHGNIKDNQLSLTTPYDLHTTLLHLQTYPHPPPPHLYGRSLFMDIPKDRTCSAAGVPKKACPCGMRVAKESCKSPPYPDALDLIMQRINKLLEPVAGLCYPVGHSHMHECATLGPKQRGMLFHAQTGHGPRLEFSALFEVATNGSIILPDRLVPAERLSKYGRMPHCVAERYPLLKPYCMCRNWKP